MTQATPTPTPIITSLSIKKKKKWNSETGEAEKLQSGYGKGLGTLAISVSSFELFEAPSFGGQRTKEGERELRQRKPRGEHKAMQPSDPSTLRHEGTIMLRE